MKSSPTEYAVYKGDQLVIMGTAEECAKELKVQPETIYYYSTDAYARKLEKRKRPENCRHAVLLNGEE